jgi:SAM-dependent methyltransferase
MLTRDDVISCFRCILGRAPESESVIAHHLSHFDSFDELRTHLFKTDEYLYTSARRIVAPLSEFLPKSFAGNSIEWKLSSDLEAKVFAAVQQSWESLGAGESFWSVLTSDEFHSIALSETKQRFFASGEADLCDLINAFERNFIDYSSICSAIDFGCGLGRVTHWLQRKFSQYGSMRTYGVDISATHLAQAREELPTYGLSGVEFIHTPSVDSLQALPKVDLIFTRISLQHSPPPVIVRAIDALLAALNPAGYAHFQVPTYRLDYSFKASEWLTKTVVGQMEMHCVPQRVVFELIEDNNCELIELSEDNSAGLRNVFRSNVFFVRKRASTI